MSIVSYAQNFEDVMLWRALGHLADGLYVDIGAQHPLVDSVSMAFHQAGWRGVHVEPVPAYAQMLREARPGDTVLQVALGAAEGTLELHVIEDSGLSTAVNEYADQHRDQRGLPARSVQVPQLTMRSALQYLAGREVHWLKIDVEGFEEQVLRGWDSSVLRPWIMVVEATRPGSPELDFAAWDPLIVGAGYRFVYFDGLNRFYVADEHAELAAAFAAPPNVFDGAQLSGQASNSWCHCVLTQAADGARAAAEQASWLRNEWDAAEARRRLAEDALAAQSAAREAAEAARATEQAEHEAALAAERAGRQAALHSHAIEQARAEAAELALAAQRSRADAAERELAALDDAQRSHALVAENTRQLLEAEHAHLAALTQQWEAAETALVAKVADLQHWSHHWYTIAEQREQTRQALLGSTSWRLTAPLRGARATARRGLDLARRAPHALRRRGVGLAGRVVRWTVRKVLANGRLSQLARGVLASHPGLKARLRQATVNADVAQQVSLGAAGAARHPAQLSERAGRLYLTMRKAATHKES